MLPHRHHLRGEDAGGAVEGREGLVEHRHVTADGAGALDEEDLLAGVGDLESGLDAGDAGPDDERAGMRGGRVGHGGQPIGHAEDRAREHGLGAHGADAERGSVLSERRQADLRGVSAGVSHGGRERRFEEAGRVPGDDYPLQVVGTDLDRQRLEAEGRHGPQVLDHLHMGQIARVADDRVEVDRVQVARARLTEIHAGPHRCLHGSRFDAPGHRPIVDTSRHEAINP